MQSDVHVHVTKSTQLGNTACTKYFNKFFMDDLGRLAYGKLLATGYPDKGVLVNRVLLCRVCLRP